MAETIPTEPFKVELPGEGGCSMILIGSTRSGKTTALKHILKTYFKKHVGVLMTHSPAAEIYKDFDILQAPDYIPQVISDMAHLNKKTNNRYDFLCVLDDVVTGVKHDKKVLEALTILRNSNLSVILCAQAITLINSAGRTNSNWVFLFKLNSDEQIEKAVKMYLNSYFPKDWTLLDKMRYYREQTADHYFFVIDNLNGRVFRSRIAV